MNKSRFLRIIPLLAFTAVFLLFGISQGHAQVKDAAAIKEKKAKRITHADRQAAADRATAARAAAAQKNKSKKTFKVAAAPRAPAAAPKDRPMRPLDMARDRRADTAGPSTGSGQDSIWAGTRPAPTIFGNDSGCVLFCFSPQV